MSTATQASDPATMTVRARLSSRHTDRATLSADLGTTDLARVPVHTCNSFYVKFSVYLDKANVTRELSEIPSGYRASGIP